MTTYLNQIQADAYSNSHRDSTAIYQQKTIKITQIVDKNRKFFSYSNSFWEDWISRLSLQTSNIWRNQFDLCLWLIQTDFETYHHKLSTLQQSWWYSFRECTELGDSDKWIKKIENDDNVTDENEFFISIQFCRATTSRIR